MECNYHNGKKINHLTKQTHIVSGAHVPDTDMMDMKNRVYAAGLPPPFTIEILEDAGRAAGVALLDIINKNPIS